MEAPPKNAEIQRSYWVLPGKLLAGEYPGSRNPYDQRKKLMGLVESGIRLVINLMEPEEKDHTGNPFAPYEQALIEIGADRRVKISVVRISIKDLSIPSAKTMHTILNTIGDALSEGKPVYIHCWGGVGRTGTVVGCYLMEHGMATADTVLDKIRELRRNELKAYRESPETAEQRKMVINWRKEEPADEMKERSRGCLLGLAVGDALGTTLEFKRSGSFKPIKDMIGGGPFHLKPGEWTDDTSMALCLAESLIECKGFDPEDQMLRYLRWFRNGYLSSTGECFDIGCEKRSFEFRKNRRTLLRIDPAGSCRQRVDYAPCPSSSFHVVESLEAALWGGRARGRILNINY
jgi:hypothetical protein